MVPKVSKKPNIVWGNHTMQAPLLWPLKGENKRNISRKNHTIAPLLWLPKGENKRNIAREITL